MKKILLGTTAFAVVLAVATPAQLHAQTSAQPAVAQVQEVVITAQKRKEKLSSVAVAASVVSAASLATQGVTDISDLTKVVPSVSIEGSTNGRVPYAMRGVSTTANESNVGLSSGVAILLDGVPVPSDSDDGNQIEDIDHIEVLKGPQATLGGRTAAAGVINMVTRGPKDKWTGQFSTTFTTDGEKRGSVYVAGPISPALDFSLSGYGNQVPYPIKNLATGDYTTNGSTGVRGKLQYKPDALLTATLAGHFAQTISYGDNFVYTYLTPGSTLRPSLGVGASEALKGVTVNDQNLDGNSIAQNVGQRTTDRDVSLNLEYLLGNLTLGSTTAYSNESQRSVQDLFSVDTYFANPLISFLNGIGMLPVNEPFYNNQWIRNDIKQVSQEFKITSPAEDRLNYVAGAFFSDTTVKSQEIRPLILSPVDYTATPTTSTYDLYGRVTYKFTPQFSLTGGLRVNDDVLGYKTSQVIFGSDGAYNSSGNYSAGQLVGDLSAKYNFDASNMIYASYARGYAPAAYNTASALTSNATFSPVDKMTINAFELGSKGRYLDGQLTVNADLFYTIYDNYQVETYAAGTGLAPPLVLANAPQAQTHGAEVEGTLRPTLSSTINLSAAYIDATFVKYTNGQCWFPTGSTAGTACYETSGDVLEQNLDGKPLPNSPKFKFVANGEQRFPLDSIGYDVVAGATYTYRTSAQMLVDQSPYGVQSAFGLLNLDLGLESQSGLYSATIFVNNVTNHPYYTDIEDFWNSVWSSGTTKGNETVIGQPGRDAKRFAGIRLTAKF